MNERAARRPKRVRERAEGGVGGDPVAGSDVGPDQLGIVQRCAEKTFEYHTGRGRFRLELELNPWEMVERRDNRPGGQILQRESPPLFLLACWPGIRGETVECLEARLAQPLRLTAPETVLLDHSVVEQQRDLCECGRTSQWRLASGA